MTFLRFSILCLSLLAPEMLVAAQGFLTGWDPLTIRQTLVQGNSTNLSLTFAYDNTSSSSVGYLIYVQDDASCPRSSSSHSWIPLNLMSGLMPVEMGGSAPISIPLNTSGLAYGTYVTNVCFVADNDSVPTNVAVPVTLKSVAVDDIFMDEFE